MNSWRHDHCLSCCYFSLWRNEISYDDHINSIPSWSFCHFCFTSNFILAWAYAFFDEIFQISVSVWKPMSYIDFIIIISDLKVETQSVGGILSRWSRVIANIITSSKPSRMSLFLPSFWVEKHFHPLIIMRVILTEICNVELVWDSNFSICNFEVKPLSVSLWIVIRPHM